MYKENACHRNEIKATAIVPTSPLSLLSLGPATAAPVRSLSSSGFEWSSDASTLPRLVRPGLTRLSPGAVSTAPVSSRYLRPAVGLVSGSASSLASASMLPGPHASLPGIGLGRPGSAPAPVSGLPTLIVGPGLSRPASVPALTSGFRPGFLRAANYRPVRSPSPTGSTGGFFLLIARPASSRAVAWMSTLRHWLRRACAHVLVDPATVHCRRRRTPAASPSRISASSSVGVRRERRPPASSSLPRRSVAAPKGFDNARRRFRRRRGPCARA